MQKSKRIVLTLMCLINIIFLTSAQYKLNTFNTENNLSRYAKVWGLLKYYHPEVAKGEIDWDSVLVNNIQNVKVANSKSEFNEEILKLIYIAGNMNICDTCKYNNTDSIKRYPDFGWSRDSSYFSRLVIDQLEFIVRNKYPFDNFYVQSVEGIGCASFDNENNYKEMVFISEEYRLLTLFRYWNVINYYFPYKHLMDKEWDEVLIDFIPRFIGVSSSDEYNLLISELTTNIGDTHALTTTKFFLNFLGNNFLPFDLELAEGHNIITEVYHELDSTVGKLIVGDIILEINNQPIQKIRDNLSKYIAASNDAVKQYLTSALLSRIRTDSIKLKLLRNDSLLVIIVPCVSYNEIYSYSVNYHSKIKALNWISEDIACIKMAYIYKNMVDSIMQIAVDAKAIIFDLRGYPRNTMYMISEYLNPQSSAFTLIYKPDMDYPGVFRYTKTMEAGPEKYNKDYYKGRVVLLVNERTQSHGEFTCMALQTAPDVTIIGRQTSGADGNVSRVKLPGNIETRFSGIGIAYPDGNETQRIGIIPDIEVFLTIEGVKNGEDEVLEAAISYLKLER